jgi:hypothetical protein
MITEYSILLWNKIIPIRGKGGKWWLADTWNKETFCRGRSTFLFF